MLIVFIKRDVKTYKGLKIKSLKCKYYKFKRQLSNLPKQKRFTGIGFGSVLYVFFIFLIPKYKCPSYISNYILALYWLKIY